MICIFTYKFRRQISARFVKLNNPCVFFTQSLQTFYSCEIFVNKLCNSVEYKFIARNPEAMTCKINKYYPIICGLCVHHT